MKIQVKDWKLHTRSNDQIRLRVPISNNLDFSMVRYRGVLTDSMIINCFHVLTIQCQNYNLTHWALPTEAPQNDGCCGLNKN